MGKQVKELTKEVVRKTCGFGYVFEEKFWSVLYLNLVLTLFLPKGRNKCSGEKNRISKSPHEKQMIKSATPMKYNQGTNVGKQKIK